MNDPGSRDRSLWARVVDAFTASSPSPSSPMPILDPSVRELAPRDRLIRLRDWLRAGGADGKWTYTLWFPKRWNSGMTDVDCGSACCAGGHYQILTGMGSGEPGSDEFEITVTQYHAIFYRTHSHVPGVYSMADVTPAHVADVIDAVLDDRIR